MWSIDGVKFQPGGRLVVPRRAAPLGVRLPYRRAKGEAPDGPTRLLDAVAANGWSVRFVADPGGGFSTGTSAVPFGDLLLELTVARALLDASAATGAAPAEVVYRGPRHRLMERCDLPFAACEDGPQHTVSTPAAAVSATVPPTGPPSWAGAGQDPSPGAPRTHVPPWLDPVDDEVEVHSALPMRYYLEVEQRLGVRLPLDGAPAPRFRSRTANTDPRHVVLVSTSSAYGSRQDYGVDGLLDVARSLTELAPGAWRFTLLTNDPARQAAGARLDCPLDVVVRPDATDCVDLFGGCALVVGNDTGLTHLAALTARPDGTGPQVVALYGRFSHLKWVTGSTRHHSVATPLSQMMAFADVGLYINSYGLPIDDTVWGTGDVTAIAPSLIARYAYGCLTGEAPHADEPQA
ncbi:glycosyltransferase family 9 protein [Streptomyces sp. SL13]|uniref:Glycosyltransferase family 9 protein n=1 Tax=Streptantibioticus silvisoli TaxID=2705255 RepID=A0AA90H8U8_9ACTN|nr:glycosyltransferase family 9 protein [Streptantibioticus silvisoli]MDI5973336.1 glycosyltransferase family 9 protein [Streptantibioticus silvisoli]